ncbi:AzlD domain-containing protein [Celeribacter sp.]|uniref:AzlD domain-containing protein n=1 Tax=Celeribacter sp. TaxID=1890673 RepID=UPI003A8DE7E7
MDKTPQDIWIIIIAMGVGTYLIRLSFIGLIGDRTLPPWLLRMLRYTPVAVLPGVVAPMLVPSDGASDPMQLAAALVTLVVGLTTRNVLYAIIAGFGLFFGAGALIG